MIGSAKSTENEVGDIDRRVASMDRQSARTGGSTCADGEGTVARNQIQRTSTDLVGSRPGTSNEETEGTVVEDQATGLDQRAGPRTRANLTKPKADPVPEMKTEPAVPQRPAATPATRKAIIPAGQPLPPQPSANEISPEALAKVNEVEKKAKKLTLMELTERTCKWPVGDPATEHFWFCGLPVQAGKPYCEAHVGVAFQPMSSRRDRRR